MDTCIHVHMHTWTHAHTLNSITITHTLMHHTLLKASALRATTSELYTGLFLIYHIYIFLCLYNTYAHFTLM